MASPSDGVDGLSQLVQRSKRRGAALSCAECRRLKLKCSRVFPCSNCVKKGCGPICPEGSLTTGKGNRFVLANTEVLHDKISELSARVRQLEDALQHSHRMNSPQQHPLLAEELLQIKRPLERERIDMPLLQDDKTEPAETIDAMGSLSISQGGRSTFFGTTANSWYLLQNEEGSDEEVRSPHLETRLPPDIPWLSASYPFSAPIQSVSSVRESILEMIPGIEVAQQLGEMYYRHAAWMYEPVDEQDFYSSIFHPIYAMLTGGPLSPEGFEVKHHALAVFFMVLALGALMDLDRVSHGPDATRYYHLGRACLAMDNVFEEQSIHGIQALLLMCHFMFLNDIERPRWVTMGIVVKLAQSLGLHRDSSKWNLSNDESHRRRCLMWEIYVYDSWQSLTFGRPPSFSLTHIDSRMPHSTTKNAKGEVEMSFNAWKHGFASQCQSIVMDQAFGARPPSYKTIQELDKKVRLYYVPPSLQVPGFGTIASNGAGLRNGIGEPEQPSTQLTLQRYIAFAIKEITIFYMHRGFFASALEDSPSDPMGSKYAASVLAAYTSACSFVGVISSLFKQHPGLSERMWFLFTHVFSCSIVLAAIAAKTQMAIAPSALSHLDASYVLFSQVSENPRAAKILPILRKLQERAHNAFAGVHSPSQTSRTGSQVIKSEDSEFAALGGGTTRLVSRRKSTSPSSPSHTGSPTPSSQPSSPPLASISAVQQNQSQPHFTELPQQHPSQHMYQAMPASQWGPYPTHLPTEYSNYSPFADASQASQSSYMLQQQQQQHQPQQQSMGMRMETTPQQQQQYYNFQNQFDINMHNYPSYEQSYGQQIYDGNVQMQDYANSPPDIHASWNNFVAKYK